MDERLYTAQRMDAAIRRVKRELGHDAVIVSSRLADGRYQVRAVPAERAEGVTMPTSASDLARAGSLLHRLLLKSGLPAEVADALSAGSPSDARTLRDAVEALTVRVRETMAFDRPDLSKDRRRIAFVGPTGVGKTTTLAKVAAHAALIHQRRVGIITLDTYRVGALSQIEAFADLIGVPLETARDERSFGRALRRLSDADLVFIDTAGRAPRDKAAFMRLAEILHCAEDTEDTEAVEVNLLVSATTRPAELDEIVERHAVLLPSWITITKVDEARQPDVLALAQLASARPLAWVTTGQRVPEDLVEATPEGVAAALTGEEVFQ
ncbi:MAG: hypothetical protein AB7S26_36270 [Sandaracinaceae bacterium]